MERRHFLKYAGLTLATAAAGPVVANSPPVRRVADVQADLVVLFKSSRKLVLYKNREPLRIYKVDLGFSPVGHKWREGDGRTPEGAYTINRRNPDSAYHLSLGISYPNAQDVAFARKQGVSPGGDIFIHGGPTRFADRFKRDWTAGCIAVSDREIEEIWAMVPDGTPILITP